MMKFASNLIKLIIIIFYKIQPKISNILINKLIAFLYSKTISSKESKVYSKLYYFLNRLLGNYKFFNPDDLLVKSISRKMSSSKEIKYFDIGGEEGLYFDLLNKHIKNIQEAYLFELDAINYKILKYKYEIFDNVKVINIGFSTKSQRVKIYSRFPGSQEYEIYKSEKEPLSPYEQMVNFETLDEYYLKNLSGKNIDYLNINYKEDSLKILLSGKSVLPNFKLITFTVKEISSDENKNLNKCIKLFASNNFELFKFSELGLIKIDVKNKLVPIKNNFYSKFVAIRK